MKTKWGNAKIMNHGYYRITDNDEGCTGKLLHRLIYEDYHKITLMPQSNVHHIDGNKINNDINNLKLMSSAEHSKLHHKGKKVSDETKKKMSKWQKGENANGAKLTESQVWTIKRMLDLNYSQGHIARVFGVHKANISKINTGIRWGHVSYRKAVPKNQ